MWVDATQFHTTARQELPSMLWWLGMTDILAGSIPILTVVVFMITPGVEFSFLFRVMIASLLVIGAVGYQFVTVVTRRMSRTVALLVGADGRAAAGQYLRRDRLSASQSSRT
jgi:hypothetical protein